MRFIQLVTCILGIFFILLAFPLSANAQDAGGNVKPSGHAISFHLGPLLPNSIGATDEILNGVGARYGYPLGNTSLAELGYTQSHSKGVEYSDVDLSIRGDIPFQDLYAFGLLGLDLMRLRGSSPGDDATYYAGLHAGGGVLAHVADTLFMRMEMRFNFHPGTILFFGFGFEYRFGAGGGGN